MKSIRFERWCSVAVGRIRFKPDRKEVYEELYAHMEDQYEELTAAGLSEKEAEDALHSDPGSALLRSKATGILKVQIMRGFS